MRRNEALRLAQYALHGGVTMELPPDSGRIRKIADSILDAHKRGSEEKHATSFVNENARHIDIEVSGTDEPGDVRIVVRGPHSESENIVTRMEAVELHRLIGAYLATQQTTAHPAPTTEQVIAEAVRLLEEKYAMQEDTLAEFQADLRATFLGEVRNG